MPGFGHDQYGTDYFGKGTHAKDILWNSLPQVYKDTDGEKEISYSGKVGVGQGAPTYVMLPFTAVKPGTLSLTYLVGAVSRTVTDKDGDGIIYRLVSTPPDVWEIVGTVNYTTGRVIIYSADLSCNVTAGFTYSEKYLEKFISAIAAVFEEIRFLTENFGSLIDPMDIRPDLLYNLSGNLVQLEEFWLQDEKFCRLFLDNVGLWTLRKGEVYGIQLLARCLGFEAEIVDLWEYELLPIPAAPPPPPIFNISGIIPITPDPNVHTDKDPDESGAIYVSDDYLVRAGDNVLCGPNYTPDTGDTFYCLVGQSELLPEQEIIDKPDPDFILDPTTWVPYADRKRWNTNKFHIVLS